MKRFIVSTPHPDSLAGADYRQNIFGPFDTILQATEFRDWFFKKFLHGAGSKEELIQIQELNDPLEKVGFKPKPNKMTDGEKITKIESMILQPSKIIFYHGVPILRIWVDLPDQSLCLIASYVSGAIGFSLFDRQWDLDGSELLESKVFRFKNKTKDPSVLVIQDIRWIKMQIGRIKKKYTAQISPV